MSEEITIKRQIAKEGVAMNDEEFQSFCVALDKREQESSIPHYPDPARRFLWKELSVKAMDVREAVKKWVMTGVKTELSVSELSVADDFWTQPLTNTVTTSKSQKNSSIKRRAISTTMLERVRKMNYIAAAFAIDWLRREPRKALTVLHRGMI